MMEQEKKKEKKKLVPPESSSWCDLVWQKKEQICRIPSRGSLLRLFEGGRRDGLTSASHATEVAAKFIEEQGTKGQWTIVLWMKGQDDEANGTAYKDHTSSI